MWTPTRLKLTNFISHRNSEFVPEKGKATMIFGVNLTDKGQKSNGAGKSAILEGLSVAILNSSLRKVSTKELVKRGCDSGKIELQLNNELIGVKLDIIRTIHTNTTSAEIEILVNDKPLDHTVPRNGKEKLDVRQANQWILDQIQIPREDILNYFLVSKKQYTPYFQLSDGNKKEVIGRFSQANTVDGVFEIINDELVELDKSKNEYDDEITTNQGKIDAYQEQIDEFDLDAVTKKRDEQVERLETSNTTLQAANDRSTLSLDALKKELEAFKKQKDEVPAIEGSNDIDEKSLEQFKQELREFNEERREINTKLTTYSNNVVGVVECPECTHKWNPAKKDVDVAQQLKMKGKAENLLVEVDVDIAAVNKDIEVVDKKISERDAKIAARRRTIRQIDTQINNKESEISTANQQIASNERTIDLNIASIAQLQTAEIANPTTDLQQKIDTLELENDRISEEIDKIDTQVFDKNEWTGHFTKFKTHLSNKTIGVMEAYCNEYLKRMGTSLSLKMEGYKVNRDGSIREDITTHVLRDGVNEGIIHKFSGGEEVKLIISMIMTQQKLINKSCSNGGLDLCFLDEIIESVDSDGVYGLMKSLNMLEQTIMVITHATFDRPYPHSITITKSNGDSQIS